VKEEAVRHIEVEYPDGRHVFIDDYLLEGLIKSRQITQFFRPSEKRWITIGIEPVRTRKGDYRGKERRRAGRSEAMIPLWEQEKCPDCLSP